MACTAGDHEEVEDFMGCEDARKKDRPLRQVQDSPDAVKDTAQRQGQQGSVREDPRSSK